MSKQFSQANILLLLIALIWGGTFIIVKQSLAVLHPMQVIAYRFTLAFILVFLVKFRTVRRHWRASFFPGIGLGLLLFIAFDPSLWSEVHFAVRIRCCWLQCNTDYIFKHSLSGKTPGALFGVLTNRRVVPGCALSQLLLAMVICFWLPFFRSAYHLPDRPSPAQTVNHHCHPFGFVALVAWGTIIPAPNLVVDFSATTWYALIYLGLMATGLAFLAQSYAQRDASPIHTAIMLATEPAFATVLAISLGFEALTLRLMIGGVLIIAGIIFSSSGESFAASGGKMN